MKHLILIKLGGSLITIKDKPMTPRTEIITSLAKEVTQVVSELPDAQCIIGNGAGSFGHYKVIEHGLKEGIHSSEQLIGYAEVQDAVAQLNRMVTQELLAQHIPACSVAPSSIMTSKNKHLETVHLDSVI